MSAPTADQLKSLLDSAFQAPVHIESSDHLAPWSVMRCRLTGAAPRSVIVKWLRENPHGLRMDPRQVATEQAALEFLAEIEFARAPRLIAAAREASVLVLEDLAPRTPLADQIRRRGAPALVVERRAFAQTIGVLNAATAGKSAVYDAIRSRYGVDRLAVRERGLGPDWPKARPVLEALGLTLPTAAEGDLAGVAETLVHPGPFLSFSNGDAAENNFLVDQDDGRLIDFEFAGYCHALTCARWIHVPGPAWITVDDAISAELEAVYRQALSRGIAEAEDDRLFGEGMAAACLAFACDRLGRFAILDDRGPGDPSRLQMVSTIEAAVAAARRHRAWAHLADWLERTAHWLRRRWADADVDISRYPAYAPR